MLVGCIDSTWSELVPSHDKPPTLMECLFSYVIGVAVEVQLSGINIATFKILIQCAQYVYMYMYMYIIYLCQILFNYNL